MIDGADFFDRYADRIMPEPNSGCWLWIGSQTGKGYGNLTTGNRSAYAHRMAYEAVNGPGSASGWVVRHRCDNPCCCNPDHLLVGTHKDNNDDAWARGRMRVVRGEDAGRVTLTTEDVVRARQLAADGMPICEIARTLGHSHQTIGYAVTGQTWTHLPGSVAREALTKGWRAPTTKGNARLTASQVAEIKRRLRAGERGRALAKVFGVKPAAISSIRVGRTWSHVEP